MPAPPKALPAAYLKRLISQKMKVRIAEIIRQLPRGMKTDQFLPLKLMSPGRLNRLNFEPNITIRPIKHIIKPVTKINLPVLSGSNISVISEQLSVIPIKYS